MLHLGYGWLAFGFFFLGLDALVSWLPETTALHALTVGAIGTMTLAVMTRATLGHTGRALTAGPGTTAVYVLVSLAAIFRLLAPLAAAQDMTVLSVSAACWSGAFGLFVALYLPALAFAPTRTRCVPRMPRHDLVPRLVIVAHDPWLERLRRGRHDPRLRGRCFLSLRRAPASARSPPSPLPTAISPRPRSTRLPAACRPKPRWRVHLAGDAGEGLRQIHVVDHLAAPPRTPEPTASNGAAACRLRAISVAGNMLANGNVVAATLESYLANSALPLPERMQTAMEAGQAAGGDRRGKQSAAMKLITAEDFPDLDIRVDDHPEPLAELRRLLTIWRTEGTARLATAPGQAPIHPD